MTRRGFLLAAALAAAPALGAQTPGHGHTLDRIVAVVGTKPILLSQVEEQVAMMQAGGLQPPTDSAARLALRRQIVQQMVQEELLVQQAQRDTTVKVTDQEVEQQVQSRVADVRRQYASELDFQRQLRLAGFGSEEEWRRWLTDNQRRSDLVERLEDGLKQKGKLRPITPTDQQMRDFWDQNKGTVPPRPPTVSFRQVVVTPQPDTQAVLAARAQADSILAALRGGADFAQTARRFTDDSATRDAGGELGWFRRGVMLKPFEDAAFRLKPGDLSPVVRTTFGFHIIQVERIQPAEVEARHILIAPSVSPAQVDLAHRLADSIHAALARGASFDSLARRYSDPDEPKLAEAVSLTDPAFPPEYQKAVTVDSTLGLKPVFAVGVGSRRVKFVVLDVTAREAAGAPRFEDVKDQIRDQLSQNLAIEHYVDQLRRLTYVDVRF